MIAQEVKAQVTFEMVLLVGGIIFFAAVVGLITKALVVGQSPNIGGQTNTVVNQIGN